MATASARVPIWDQLLDRSKAQVNQSGARPDANLYIVGPRGSGKSTLLSKYTQPDKSDIPKPTEGLDYTFVRKPAANPSDPKELAHLWELSGGQELSSEVLRSSNILGPEQVATAVVAVVVDLSQPSQALQSAITYLQLVRAKIQQSLSWLQQKGSKLPEQLRLRAKKYVGSSHEDKDIIQHTGISVLLVAAKEDTFRVADAESRQLLGQSLRYVAHLYGASLVHLGNLKGASSQGSARQRDAAADKAALSNFRLMLTHMLFTGMDKRMKLRTEAQLDPLKPLMVPFGSDRFADIGAPKGMRLPEPGSQAALDAWLGATARAFPSPAPSVKHAPDADQQLYAEPGIDTAKQELEAKWQARQHKKSLQSVSASTSAIKSSPASRQQLARRRTDSSKEAL